MTKVCTKCGVEKELLAFSKDNGQKSGLRPECKECAYAVHKIRMQSEKAKQLQREADKRYKERNKEKVKEKQRQYDKTPKRVESRRLRSRIYYQSNPDHKKESAKRSYMKHFNKNKERRNERNRNIWRNNEEFRKKMLQRASEKYQANREKYCECCNKELPKYSMKYCDDCRCENYRDKNIKWKNKAGKEYLNKLQNKCLKRRVDELTDGYVIIRIRGSDYPNLKKEDIPESLIELKRQAIKLKREIKKINNDKD